MKSKKLYTKLLLVGSMLLTSGGLSSCEDFLTILPTDQLPEENFWQEKGDLENVRAGAYQQLAAGGQTERILLWGELRSDNLTLNSVSNTNIMYLQTGVLQPSVNMFDWSGFYTGINYCNLVLEQGDKMTVPGNEVDPSFTRRDWQTTRAEVLALRALYYFYLVRAYRDVPFVTASVRTDAQARHDMPEAQPGVAILGELIDSLEANVKYAASNLGSDYLNKSRFTKQGVYALLADMYLWRGCLLTNFMNKPNHGKVNMTDVLAGSPSVNPGTGEGEGSGEGSGEGGNEGSGEDNGNGESGAASSRADEGTASNGSYVTKDNVPIDQAYCNELAKYCFAKASEHASTVIKLIDDEYRKELSEKNNVTEEEKNQPYPLYFVSDERAPFKDEPYNNIFGDQLSRESILELNYDGTTTLNSTVNNYISRYADGAWKLQTMAMNNAIIASATTVNPTVGFGKTDMRLWETCNYKSSDVSKPLTKFVAKNITFTDITDLTGEDNSTNYTSQRTSDANDAHWPVYRLSDVMLIKAEAIARSSQVSPEDLQEGFRLVNQIFKRCNPALVPTSNTDESIDDELRCDRVNDDYGVSGGAFTKTQSELLSLLYRERQREFIGEGKRWFDIVRQVEYTNDPKTVLTTFITLKTEVVNRLYDIYAMYVPIYSEELKVNTSLKQNPVWERYSKK